MELNDLSEDYLNVLLKGFKLLDFCNILFCDENLSSFRKIFPLFYKIPCMIIYYATMTMYLIKVVKGDMVLIEIVHSFSLYVVSIQTVMTSRKKKIKAIVLQLGRIWRNTGLSEEQIIKKNALLKRLNFRYAVFYWMAFFGAWEYLLFPLIDTLFHKFILKQEYEMLLPINCVFPFDPTQNWLTYLAVYMFQIYTMFHIVYCYTGSETILIALSSHLSTEFTLLQYDFENLVPESDNDVYGERNKGQNMGELVKRHQQLIRLAQDLDDNFNGIVFINLSCATIMTCFLGLSILASKGAINILKNIIMILAGTYPIYNVCFHAELLKEASSEVGDAAYKNMWYMGNKEHRRAICFIIKRSQTPCCLTSLKFNQLALSTFKTVMSTTWSYFSLASSVYEDK